MAQLQEAEIRARLWQARDQAGISRKRMADLLQVHEKSVENYEKERVPWALINAWAKVTGTSVEWLMHGRETNNDETNGSETLTEIRDLLVDIRSLLLAATAPEGAEEDWVEWARQVREKIATDEEPRSRPNGRAGQGDPPHGAHRAHGA